MVHSPKTTAAGLCIIISSLAMLIGHWFQGTLSMNDVQNLVAAMGGVGFIMTKDDN